MVPKKAGYKGRAPIYSYHPQQTSVKTLYYNVRMDLILHNHMPIATPKAFLQFVPTVNDQCTDQPMI